MFSGNKQIRRILFPLFIIMLIASGCAERKADLTPFFSGTWYVDGNSNSVLELRDDGTFQTTETQTEGTWKISESTNLEFSSGTGETVSFSVKQIYVDHIEFEGERGSFALYKNPVTEITEAGSNEETSMVSGETKAEEIIAESVEESEECADELTGQAEDSEEQRTDPTEPAEDSEEQETELTEQTEDSGEQETDLTEETDDSKEPEKINWDLLINSWYREGEQNAEYVFQNDGKCIVLATHMEPWKIAGEDSFTIGSGDYETLFLVRRLTENELIVDIPDTSEHIVLYNRKTDEVSGTPGQMFEIDSDEDESTYWNGYHKSNDSILQESGYKPFSSETYDLCLVDGEEWFDIDYLTVKPVENEAYLFDFRFDFDNDGQEELLAGVTEMSKIHQGVDLVVFEYDGKEWNKEVSLGQDEYQEYCIGLTGIMDQISSVFFIMQEGEPYIYIENWNIGVVATGEGYDLRKLKYENGKFVDQINPDGDWHILSYGGSDYCEDYFTFNYEDQYDEWVMKDIRNFKDTFDSTGLIAPEGLTAKPLYLQNKDAFPLLAVHNYFTYGSGEIYKKWRGESSDISSFGEGEIIGYHGDYYSTVRDTSFGEQEEYILEDSSRRRLSLIETRRLSDEERQMAVNEIYARHGYIFENQKIQSYFEQRSWYKGSILYSDFDSGLLSEIENINIRILQGNYMY